MSDKGPTMAANKMAMSRALGAAFLSHQVEQLEKSVNTPQGAWREKKNTFANQRLPPFKQADQRRRNGRESYGDVDFRRRRSHEDYEETKDADVIIVDASVLVHALSQVKKWCRDGRQEVVIVPLEVLNTLDLLKKGTTSLAVRARAASRLLEAQVGVNPRIRVQQDDAYVLWDQIKFRDEPDVVDKAMMGSPEWIRRTICCARWEADEVLKKTKSTEPKIALAVITTAPHLSPTSPAGKLPDGATLAPVPIPLAQASKHELRVAGSLVAYWGQRSGLDVLEVKSEDASEDEPRHGNRNSASPNIFVGGGGFRGGPGPKRGAGNGPTRGRRMSLGRDRDGGDNGGGLVERPPAVKAMMEMVAQPNSKVVRVLARGEKLEPDP
ncbi:hypothetical protein PLEOSDRAFT_1114632 [Pleurotus ostreatus PC15]|uniref:PIN domain-containing protein n=1 Tax=Pleurotus ostreatus (strain PC15) TaxID=1137138 RepID=A0A067N412_PLEO1|nr:hypothetical protein PLEOSDRAFT_1114632 [Pleurotus ostreatus PC15]